MFKGIVGKYIKKTRKKSESPMGFEPMTFRTPGVLYCTTVVLGGGGYLGPFLLGMCH